MFYNNSLLPRLPATLASGLSDKQEPTQFLQSVSTEDKHILTFSLFTTGIK